MVNNLTIRIQANYDALKYMMRSVGFHWLCINSFSHRDVKSLECSYMFDIINKLTQIDKHIELSHLFMTVEELFKHLEGRGTCTCEYTCKHAPGSLSDTS